MSAVITRKFKRIEFTPMDFMNIDHVCLFVYVRLFYSFPVLAGNIIYPIILSIEFIIKSCDTDAYFIVGK
jgi:hypothetical protein